MRNHDLSFGEHHQLLELRFAQLMAQVADEDPLDLRCQWLLFERELDEHMTMEERELLPCLMGHDPAEAAAIREEHQQIRATLAELGLAVDLHTLRADAVAAFVHMLRGHARREERLLYPLTGALVSQGRLGTLRRQLSALSSRLIGAFRPGPWAN
jgi:hypothetical protein